MASTDETPTKGTKTARLQRTFRNEGSDELTSRATPETTHVVFKVLGNGQVIEFDLRDVFGGTLPPPCVARAAAAFGINTSAGNMLTGVENPDDPEEVAEAIEHRLESFKAGRWSAEREGGGGRPKLIWLALLAFRAEQGAPTDDAAMAKFKPMLDEKEKVKSWMANEKFMRHYLRIKEERAARSSKAPVKAASDSELTS